MASGASPTLQNFGKEMTVSLLGSVIDDLGRSVEKASVALTAGKAAIAVARSNERGEFEFSNQAVKVGFYSMRATIPDYEPAEEKLTLLWEMKDQTLDVVLRVKPYDKQPMIVAPEEEQKIERQFQAQAIRETLGLSNAEKIIGYDDDQSGGSGGAALTIPEPPEDKAKYVCIRVLFATDRNPQRYETTGPRGARVAVSDPKKRFGNEWAANGTISFGACEVLVPNKRPVGSLPRPRLFKLQFREDPNKHIVLKTYEELDATLFFREVSQRGPSVLFFVHGYCVTFPEAIYRTAQIVRDIQFEGAPICYSWPSRGAFWAYKKDEESIQWTRPHLYSVLQEAMKLQGVKTINIIAHSMGNRAVIECVNALAKEFSSTKVNQVVFAAPDVNTGIFGQFLDSIEGAAKRFTLYASSNDKPLKWSQWFSGFDRAGQGGPKLLIHPILDSIDASAQPCGVLDHSYYGSTFTVLSDIHELFSYNSGPPRFAIDGPRNNGQGPYWEIRT